jgi:hypothetical protein
MIDFSKTLIRCSSLSCLFTEPQSKADKLAGNLSKTAKTHLIQVYTNAIWGVEKDLTTKQMDKGIIGEEEGITLLSRVDGKMYVKNDERKENEWISGHADVLDAEEVVDIKLSWDAFTFMANLADDVNDMYFYQLQGYMALWGLNRARIAYCLVDTPESIRNAEKYRLLTKMDVISEESPAFKVAWEKMERNMIFDHIDPNLRVICHYVERDQEIIDQIPTKVARAREFLWELSKKHLHHNQILQFNDNPESQKVH